MDNVITLVKPKMEQDARGVWKETDPIKRTVFCKVNSISRSEFFDAGRAGLNPEFVITMFAGDYEGEDIVEYEGETYAIYRTYKREGNTYLGSEARSKQDLMQDYIELYVERKGGTNAGLYAD